MSKSKLGKSVSDIFVPFEHTQREEEASSTPEISLTKTNRGRPQVHSEKWTKMTTVLFDRQIAWLDHLGADIRMHTGAAMSRAEIIRALLAAVEQSGINLSEVTSESHLTDLLLERLVPAKEKCF